MKEGRKERGKEGERKRNLAHTAEYEDNMYNPNTKPKWRNHHVSRGVLFFKKKKVSVYKINTYDFCFYTILKSPFL